MRRALPRRATAPAAALALLLLVASLGAPVSAEPPHPPHRPGEILVQLQPGLDRRAAQRVAAHHGTTILEVLESRGLYRMRLPAGHSAVEMSAALARDPACEYAEPNHLGRGGGFRPDDSFFGLQWHLDDPEDDHDIDAVEGWALERGSPRIRVAVLDTGIDTDHPEFAGRLLPGYDFVNEDADPEADHPHGSAAAGLLAANADNAFGVAGVDHRARILPVKVLDAENLGTTFDLAQGLDFAAAQGADVISMSLIDYPTDSETLNRALQRARRAGAVLVACAGNGGLGDADVSGPGASPLTISVGATTLDDDRAFFSGTGRALDVVAPSFIVVTVDHDNLEDAFNYFTGCSAATPIAAGIASLLLAVDDSLGHEGVRKLLAASAEDQVGDPSEDTPGRDDFFGYGRVNLAQALRLARAPGCGDGRRGPGEACDDGNRRSGDCCSATCQLETENPCCRKGRCQSRRPCAAPCMLQARCGLDAAGCRCALAP